MSRAFYLTISEMKILLYRRRISGIIVFDELKKGIGSEEDIKIAVESLINNGYLVPDYESFSLNTELKLVFEILENCRYGFRIRAMQDRVSARCMYISGENSVLIRMDERNKNMIRIETFDNPR